MSETPQEPAKVRKNVHAILDSVGAEDRDDIRGILGNTVQAGRGQGRPLTATERINAIVDNIVQINKKPESEIKQEDIDRRNELAKALVKIDSTLSDSGLSRDDLDKEVLGGEGDEAFRARTNAKKIAEAQRNNEIENADVLEETELDLTDVQLIRTSYQCFLLYNTDFFSEYHKRLLSVTSQRDLDSGYKPLLPGEDTIRTSGYLKRIRKGGDPREPRIFLLADNSDSSIINNKFSLCPGNEKFVDITTSEYAQLQPLLRIYKIYRNKDGQNVDKKVELEFRNKTGLEGIDKIIEIDQPVGSALLGQRSRGVECGVKSFDWRFLGSNDFTATRDIEATLVLHAQHFHALLETRDGLNLISTSQNTSELTEYKYLDLIIQPDCTEIKGTTKKQDYNNYYNPGCYEIQIDVGYAPQKGEMREIICCQKDSLYLVHVDHKFDFKEDGTLDLTINYRGRLETLINDRKFNTLLPGGGFVDQINDAQGNIAKTFKSYNKLETALKSARKVENKRRIKYLERLRAAFFVDLRQYMYALILETMEDKKMIHSFDIRQETFLRFARWKEPKYKGNLPPKMDYSLVSDISSVDDQQVGIALQSAVAIATKDPDIDAVGKTIEEINELTERQIAKRLTDAVSKRRHTISYVYLGDLIAIVLANTLGELPIPPNITFGDINTGVTFLGTANPFKEVEQTIVDIDMSIALKRDRTVKVTDSVVNNFHLVLGNLDITDGEGETKQINLAHIPISLEVFQDFMLKNVISQNIDYYSITEFLNDLIGDTVTNMFSNDCFDGLIESDSRVSATLYTSKEKLSGQGIFEKVNNNYKEINAEKIDVNNLPFGKDIKCTDRHNEPYEYLVINTLNTVPKNLAGDYLGDQNRGDNIGDKARGILHFTYGRDRGLLKSVQFTKTDQEYRPEARFASGDGNLLNQLSNVYDATFNMIGNNIFKPGMLLYFNPEPMGVGSPWQLTVDGEGDAITRSWANIMGIGGYHLVTEVAHSIGPGSFNTTIKARHQTTGTPLKIDLGESVDPLAVEPPETEYDRFGNPMSPLPGIPPDPIAPDVDV